MMIYAPYYNEDGPVTYDGGFYRSYEEALEVFQKSFKPFNPWNTYWSGYSGIATINMDAPVSVQASLHELPSTYEVNSQ